eukprot:976883-Pleurochrysis_carterae.AAC.3
MDEATYTGAARTVCKSHAHGARARARPHRRAQLLAHTKFLHSDTRTSDKAGAQSTGGPCKQRTRGSTLVGECAQRA